MKILSLTLALLLAGCATPSAGPSLLKLSMAGEKSGESRPSEGPTNFPIKLTQQFYPSLALKHDISARYIMLVTLNADGTPLKAEILSSVQAIKAVAGDDGKVIDVSHIFDQEAVRMIMEAKWNPTVSAPAPFKMALVFVAPPK